MGTPALGKVLESAAEPASAGPPRSLRQAKREAPRRRDGARKLPNSAQRASSACAIRDGATHVIPGPSQNDNLPLKTQHFALRGRCRLEKSADQIEKDVELVMVDPMAGIFERNDPGVAEMASPPVIRRVGGPALLAIDEEGRAIDALP